MNIRITPNFLKGTVSSITSKSHAHRLLIAGAICLPSLDIPILNMSEDIYATKECLNRLFSKEDEPLVLNCRESGSTLRFFLPLVMALKDEAWFCGAGRLPDRPLSPLKEAMEEHGCSFSGEISENTPSLDPQLICHVQGRLRPGVFTLSGDVSSQYVTGLLFALPLLAGDSSIKLSSHLESRPYVDLTLDVLKSFNIDVETLPNGFKIRGNQRYSAPARVSVEGDWSNGAFWLAADFLSSLVLDSRETQVFCTGLHRSSFQGDKEIVPLLKLLRKHLDDSEFLKIDVSQIPDLLPVLSVAATARKKGITEFVGASRLRIKESDRLKAMHEAISALGGISHELEDRLQVEGTGGLTGGVVDSRRDHRIAMTAAVASIICKKEVRILGSDSVNKSYPKFWDDFKSLGGECFEF